MITIERLGAESYIYVDVGQEEPLVVKAEAAVPVRHGERARIGIPAAATYLFAADGSCIERGIRFTNSQARRRRILPAATGST